MIVETLTVANAVKAEKLVKLGIEVWQRLGALSSNARIQEGFDESDESLYAAWVEVGKAWLVHAKANLPPPVKEGSTFVLLEGSTKVA